MPVRALIDEVPRSGTSTTSCPAAPAHAGTAECSTSWRDLLGQNVIELDDLDAVCETIALTVGLGEGAIDLDGGVDDLDDIGSSSATSVRRARAGSAGRRVRELAQLDLTSRRPTGLVDAPGGGPARAGRDVRSRAVDRPVTTSCRARVRRRGQGDRRGLAVQSATPEPVHAVVRFNGGAQAAHNVLATDGRHTPSRSSAPAASPPGCARTCPGSCSSIRWRWPPRPPTWPRRASRTRSVRSPIDRDALLATPYHQAANRARETAPGRGPARLLRHGDRRDRPLRARGPGDAPRVADCAAARALARSPDSSDRLCDGSAAGPPRWRPVDAYRAFADRVPLVDRGYLGRLLAPGRSCSRARRACCSMSGAASIRTRPGRRRPSPTRRRCSPRRARPPSGSASSAAT